MRHKPAQRQKRQRRAAARLVPVTFLCSWEAEGREMLVGCSGGHCSQGKCIPVSRSSVMSWVGERLLMQDVRGRFHFVGSRRLFWAACPWFMMFPARTEVN